MSGGKLSSDQFLYPEMSQMGKKLPNHLHGRAFYKITKVCFNQESLPITFHNFHHKSLVRPKSKFPNWQGSQLMSYKTNFSRRDNIPSRSQIQHNLLKCPGGN